MDSYLSPKQLAAEFPLDERKQKDLRVRRAIPYHRLGHRTIVYRRSDIERYIKSRRVEAVGGGQ